MFTMLFNRDKGEAYELSEYMEPQHDYGHTFGGDARHEGAVPPECRKPVHLFYDLNLSDPRVGIRFADAGITRLPLYYALGNLGGSFCYRVVSDSRIEMLSQLYPKKYRAGIRPGRGGEMRALLGPILFVLDVATVKPEVIQGKEFIAVRTSYRDEYAAPGRKAGSRWTQGGEVHAR